MAISAKMKEMAPCQKELSVEVPREIVAAEFEAVYRRLQRVAHVPGFRVGHAPRDLLARHHGAKAREEVLHRLVGRTLDEAIAGQGKIDVVGRPQVSRVRIEPDQPLTYVAQLEVAPEVPLGPYKGLRITRPKSAVPEESVEQALGQLRESQAELRPLPESRAAAAGDFLLVDLTENRPGTPPKRRREVVIHLSMEKDPDGVLQALVGMNPGEKRIVPVQGGATLTAELKSLKVRNLPALDDALARSVGPYESLEALKVAVRSDLERRAQALQREALEAQACRQLSQEWTFDVPPSLVASQARRLLKQRAVELLQQGVAPDQVQQRAQVLTDQAKLDALQQVRIFFILRRIAAAEGLTASEQEVEETIQALAQRFRTTVEEIRKDLQARDLLEELAWGVLRGKVMDLILKEAETKEG